MITNFCREIFLTAAYSAELDTSKSQKPMNHEDHESLNSQAAFFQT